MGAVKGRNNDADQHDAKKSGRSGEGMAIFFINSLMKI
jgi:hypothetical protein